MKKEIIKGRFECKEDSTTEIVSIKDNKGKFTLTLIDPESSEEWFEIPKYVKFKGTEMRYIPEENKYFRDAGNWSISPMIVDGKLVCNSPDYLPFHLQPIVEITEEEWKKGNDVYVHI